MNSLGSWIDQSELDRLVAAVGPVSQKDFSPAASDGMPWNRPASSAQSQPAPVEKLPPTPATERFPVAEEVEKFRDKMAAIKDKARALGVLSPGGTQPSESPGQTAEYVAPTRHPKTKAKSDPATDRTRPQQPAQPGFRVPQGPLRLRLECFGEWVTTVSRAQAVIVADSHGDLVFERGANASWVSSVTMVATAGECASRHLSLAGNTLVHLDLPADRKLAVLPCHTKFGHLSVGLVVPRPLDPAIARAVAEAITAVVARQ